MTDQQTMPRLIKKYPNRRLYDTAISRYITLDEVRDLVLEGVEFKIVDKKTEADITRSILLQVIAEQEEKGSPTFSTDYLTNVIRMYGEDLQGSVNQYMESSLQHFVDQKNDIKDKLRKLVGGDALQPLKDLARQNKAALSKLRKDIVDDIESLKEDLGVGRKKNK